MNGRCQDKTEIVTTPLPEGSSSCLDEFLVFHDTPRKRKLKQEMAQLRSKNARDRVKIRRLRMKVHRLKKKVCIYILL